MKAKYFIILIVVFAFFMSCGEFFTTNVFSELDKPQVKSADDFDSTDDYVDYLFDKLDSETSIDNLTDEEVTAIIETLDDSFVEDYSTLNLTNEEDVAKLKKAQDAAVSIANIQLVKSGADVMVESVIAGVTNSLAGEEGGDSPEMDILGSLVPEGTTEESFGTMIDGLLSSSTAYGEFTDSLAPLSVRNEDNEVTGISDEFVNDDLVMGEVVQAALLATIVSDVVADLSADNSGTEEEKKAAAIAELYDIMTDPENADTSAISIDSENEDYAILFAALGFSSMF